MNGPNGAQSRCIYTIDGKIYTGSANNKLQYTTNEGVNWLNSTNGLTDNGVFAVIKCRNFMIVGTNSGVFYNDLNLIGNWLPMNEGLTNYSITSFCISGSKLMCGTYGGGVFATDSIGSFWYYLGSGLSNQTITSLYDNFSEIYCGTYGGGMWKSTNQGFSWSEITQGLLNFHISHITFGNGNVYCGTYGAGVFRSTNGGLNWSQVNNGLFNTTIMGLNATGNKLLTATQSGVFVSLDNGSNWTQFNTSLGNQSLTCMAISSTKIFVAAEWSGMYKRNLSEVISVNNNTSVADLNFRLNQNYPNPFNPTTNIKFSIGKSSEITMSLYDLSGKFVRTIQQGFFLAGDYNITVNLEDLPAGVYYYTLETSDSKLTQKMVLVK